MNIKIIAVGTTKEKWMQQLIADRLKLAQSNRKLQIELIDVSEEKAPDNASPAEEATVRQKEGERILAKIPERSVVITLAIDGKKHRPEDMAALIRRYDSLGKDTLCFIIGGSTGLHEQVYKKAVERFSFSAVTLPHQLAKLVLIAHLAEASAFL